MTSGRVYVGVTDEFGRSKSELCQRSCHELTVARNE